MGASGHYAVVTLCYWGFTLTDGALRMLVLLHFFLLGYSPFTLAFLFLLYEVAGILANLGGGWLAGRFGIARMIASGMILQMLGLVLLSLMPQEWPELWTILWVICAQGVAGIAKDLTKTAAKSAIKFIAITDHAQLFRWIAWFTGSKNAFKGIGFFIGGLLLQILGFQSGLWLLASLLGCLAILCIIALPVRLGQMQPSTSLTAFFAKSRGVNLLAGARIFLFGARDVWFVVAVPVFLYAAGWEFSEVGGFLAFWTIGYGFIQAIAPRLVRRSEDGLSTEVPAARLWILLLLAVPILLCGAVLGADMDQSLALPLIVGGLILFGLPFAVNSSVHSYLILAYAGSKKAAEDIGFYYAANAAGRLIGTLLSGFLYQLGGMGLSLGGSAVFLLLAAGLTYLLPRASRHAPVLA